MINDKPKEPYIIRFENVPKPISPKYRTSSLNEVIFLTNEPVEISVDGNTLQANCQLEFRWIPCPHVHYVLDIPSGQPAHTSKTFTFVAGAPAKNVEIRLLKSNGIAACALEDTDYLFLPIVHRQSGSLPKTEIGNSTNLSAIDFHLSSFDISSGFATCEEAEDGDKPPQLRFNRLRLELGDWVVVLESVPHFRDLSNEYGRAKGFAITHNCRITRRDGQVLNANDAEDLLIFLTYALSFANGGWTLPILQVGRDDQNQVVWELWESIPAADAWESIITWFPKRNEDALQGWCKCLYQLWMRPAWKDALRLVVNWYIESLHARTVDSSLVLLQVALELIAWTHFVEDSCPKMTEANKKQYDKSHAVEKIRNLVDLCGIKRDIPSELKELSSLAALALSKPYVDGPDAFTKIRNSIVHGNRLNEYLTVPLSARVDARELATWYLELAILKVCNYNGPYVNRIGPNRGWSEETAVPWCDPVAKDAIPTS